MIAKRLIAHGRVQGVWYRASTLEQARKLGLKGWVRNTPDGSVEAHAEGSIEAIDRLIVWMHRGPMLAKVNRVDEQPAEVEGHESFEIRY